MTSPIAFSPSFDAVLPSFASIANKCRIIRLVISSIPSPSAPSAMSHHASEHKTDVEISMPNMEPTRVSFG